MSFVVFTCGRRSFFQRLCQGIWGPGRSTSKSPTWSPTVGRSERPSKYRPDRHFTAGPDKGQPHLNRSSNTNRSGPFGPFEYCIGGVYFSIGRYQGVWSNFREEGGGAAELEGLRMLKPHVAYPDTTHGTAIGLPPH